LLWLAKAFAVGEPECGKRRVSLGSEGADADATKDEAMEP